MSQILGFFILRIFSHRCTKTHVCKATVIAALKRGNALQTAEGVSAGHQGSKWCSALTMECDAAITKDAVNHYILIRNNR